MTIKYGCLLITAYKRYRQKYLLHEKKQCSVITREATIKQIENIVILLLWLTKISSTGFFSTDFVKISINPVPQ